MAYDYRMDEQTIKQLEGYKVTSWAFSFDPNVAFIVDTQNPWMRVTYINNQGERKYRTYRAEINAIGLNIECVFRLDFIVIVGSDLNFYNSNKVIELGVGAEIATPLLPIGVSLQYISFKNGPGGMLTVCPRLGLSMQVASIITGGYLFPVPDLED